MNKKMTFLGGMLAGIIAVIVLYTGYNLVNTHILGNTSMSAKINEIYSVLDKYYVNSYNKDDLIEGVYKGLVYGVGDPYTSYMDTSTLETFLQQTEGVYAGIGVVVTTDASDKLVKVVSVFEGSPGERAGLLPGDKFIKINGDDITEKSLEDVVSLTKGPPGTSVSITFYRESEKRTFEADITRQQIVYPTVSHKMIDDIGYIRISNFDRVTYDQFVNAYDDLNNQSMKGLILDLRNNPGGLLDVVAKITDILVPEGIIVYTEDKNGEKEYIYSDANGIKIPLVILINENSASASEVLTGAVKDMGVGVLVGETTFGKGVVQNLYPLSDGSAVKVTIARYYTPNGICIHDVGIEPDYLVEMSEELAIQIASLTTEEDIQLQKAVEVVSLMVW